MFDLWQRSRTLVVRMEACDLEPIGYAPVPFSELIVLGGPDTFRGFRPGRFRDYSSVFTGLEYRWPIWMWMDATLFGEYGGVFGRGFEGFGFDRMKPDVGGGLRAALVGHLLRARAGRVRLGRRLAGVLLGEHGVLTMRARALLMMLLAAGCAPGVRFADRAILWKDPDDKPVPMPAMRDPPYHWVAIRDAVFGPADQVLAIDFTREAVNVNAVDETPDSTWWSDRARVPGQARPRLLSPDRVSRGAFGDEPRPLLPLTVTKGKERGGTLGFIAMDALGRQFAIKIDPAGYVSLNTSTEVVVSRLAWAAGWNVPAESIVDLRLGDLVLSPNAVTTDLAGRKSRSTRSGSASSWRARRCRPTAPSARWPACGSRARSSARTRTSAAAPTTATIASRHEDRRDLRGYGVFSAWVNNVDTTEANTLDTYVGAKGARPPRALPAGRRRLVRLARRRADVLLDGRATRTSRSGA